MTPTTAGSDNERLVDALHRIVQKIQTAGDMSALLETIMRESKILLDSEASSLFLYDADRNDFYFEVVVGGDEGIRAIRVPAGQGFVGAAGAGRHPLIVNDVANDPRHFKTGGGGGFVTRNLIAVPMVRGDRLIGVLEALNKHDGADFDETDEKILKIMAEQAGLQIENARLIRSQIQAERLAALGTTAAGLAHYIKNVLSQWKGSSTLIDIGLAQNNIGLIGEAWPILKRANDKISKLVADMLVISKEREPEREPIDLNKVISEIVEECSPRADASGVKLRAELDPTLPKEMLDPTGIHDVILNIVGNAIEAIEEAEIKNGEVAIQTIHNPETHRVNIEIEDNGPGMTPDVQARIFEPFFSTKGSRGTGLGLAVVKKTVEEHGGELKLISEKGKGTIFVITLPHSPA